MATKNASQIQAADLPVRKINIFRNKLVVPKDTLCEINAGHQLDVLYTEHGVRAHFQVVITVSLSHVHFPKQMRRFAFTLYDEECTDKKSFRPRVKHVTKREWDWGKTRSWLEHSYPLRATSERAIMKTVNWVKLVDTAYDMFLAGDMRKEGLVPYLPQKPVFT